MAVKLYLKGAAPAAGASDIFYVSKPDGSADGKVDYTTMAGVIGGLLQFSLDAAYAQIDHEHQVAALSDASADGRSLITAANYGAMRGLLGLEVGQDVQAWSASLDEYAAVNPTAAGLALLDDATAGDQLTTLGVSAFAKTMLDDVDAAAVRGTIGLTYFATGSDASNLSGNLSVNQLNGGSGASPSTFWRGDGTWAAPSVSAPTGQWVHVSSHTASASSSLDIPVTAAAFDQYMIVLVDIVLGTSAAELTIHAGTGGGPIWDTGNNYDYYIFWSFGTASTGTSSRAFVSATSNIRFGTVGSVSSPHGKPMCGRALFTGLPSGSYFRAFEGVSDYDGGGGLTQVISSGVYNQTSEITGIRLIPSSGTITSGAAILFGRAF